MAIVPVSAPSSRSAWAPRISGARQKALRGQVLAELARQQAAKGEPSRVLDWASRSDSAAIRSQVLAAAAEAARDLRMRRGRLVQETQTPSSSQREASS